MSADVEDARMAKELAALASLNATMATVTDVSQLHEFIFTRHEAYATAANNISKSDREEAQETTPPALNASYGEPAVLDELPADDIMEGWKLLGGQAQLSDTQRS